MSNLPLRARARACVSIQRGCAPNPPHTNVLLYLNPATIAGRRVLFFFLGSVPSFHTEVTPIVLCTAQSTTSARWPCYHEINTINPLSSRVLLVLVSPRDRSTSKNDQITPSPSPVHGGVIYLGQWLLQL